MHGIVTNWVPVTGSVVPAWELGPAVPTLFDACGAAGRSTAAVFGDQCLVGVMGAVTADTHWPPDGVPPASARRDADDYIDDRDTIVELVAALDAGPDLVISQLNAPDTAAHVHGPDSEAALAVYRETDALLVAARDHLDWDDTVWIVVSDHDQETARRPAARSTCARCSPGGASTCSRSPKAAPPSSAATVRTTRVRGSPRSTASRAPHRSRSPTPSLECCLAWSVPGRAFGFEEMGTELGTHGGPRTRSQVAVVTGGHPAVGRLVDALGDRRITAADWAPTVAALLDLELPGATGRSLL